MLLNFEEGHPKTAIQLWPSYEPGCMIQFQIDLEM